MSTEPRVLHIISVELVRNNFFRSAFYSILCQAPNIPRRRAYYGRNADWTMTSCGPGSRTRCVHTLALVLSNWEKAKALYLVTVSSILEPPRESWVALSWIDELTLNATCGVDHVYPQPAVEMSLVQVPLRPMQRTDSSSSAEQIGGSIVRTIKT